MWKYKLQDMMFNTIECESVARKIWIERFHNSGVKKQKLLVKYENMLMCTWYHIQLEEFWKYEFEDMMFNKYAGDDYYLSLT
jgi:hypothetical protein